MAMQSNSDDDMITGINVTPLVDVVLVLLIIFMITAPAIYQAAIKVELPKATSGEKTEHVTLRFTLLSNGELRLGKETISKDRVAEAVKTALDKDSTANAIVSADQTLSHGSVMGLIDAIKAAGMTKIAIGVQSSTGNANEKSGK